MPAVPATQKKIIGRGPDMARVTSPYALLISKSLYVVDLTIKEKNLIIQGIQLCRKYDAPCRTTTLFLRNPHKLA